MAETLGSLLDKLTIKDLRGFHLRQMLKSRDRRFPAGELKAKLKQLSQQKKLLAEEIDSFVAQAAQSGKVARDEKLKLYNPRKAIGRIPRFSRLGQVVSCLALKNSELWHLEDEARRTDVGLAFIGGVKRRIDLANQQRNDLIDRIDEIFAGIVTAAKRNVKKRA